MKTLFLFLFIGFVILFVILPLLGRTLFYVLLGRLSRKAQQQQQYGTEGDAAGQKREGEVKIMKNPGTGRKRVNRAVGDYVDYEEIKEN